jgi:hypothetical protein
VLNLCIGGQMAKPRRTVLAKGISQPMDRLSETILDVVYSGADIAGEQVSDNGT